MLPETEFQPVSEDPVKIREQLGRILQSPQFRNSKRSQALLRFVTTRALENHFDDLREKIIGFSVFGREIAYDTAHDAVVRNVAAEVRKRLAQYYMEEHHDGEVRIELPAGSYVPSFQPSRLQAEKSVLASAADLGSGAEPDLSPPKNEIATGKQLWTKRALRLAIALGGIAATLFIYFSITSRKSDFDRFWAPVIAAKRPVQIVVGQPTAPCRFIGARAAELNLYFRSPLDQPSAKEPPAVHREDVSCPVGSYLYKGDALALARLNSAVRAKGSEPRIATDSMVDYSALRDSPVIVIGASNNNWAQRLINNTRYSLAQKSENGQTISYIADALNPGASRWVITLPRADKRGLMQYEDYALITRILDPNTKQIVLLVAGTYDAGTQAASEFITDPDQVNAALKDHAPDWTKDNLQIVLSTRVLDGVPGPAKVMTIHSW